MTLEEVCREYERLTRLRDSLKAAEADHQPPFYFTQRRLIATRRTGVGRSATSRANCIG